MFQHPVLIHHVHYVIEKTAIYRLKALILKANAYTVIIMSIVCLVTGVDPLCKSREHKGNNGTKLAKKN